MRTTEVCWDIAPAGQLAWCFKPSLKMLPGHLGIMVCKHFSCSPQSESSDTQQSHKGSGWIPRQLFLLPGEYLTAQCWVHLGLQHLPTFLGKVSYCAEQLPSYVRAGSGGQMLKGAYAVCKSLLLSGVGVLLLVCVDPQLWWLSSAGARARLGCTTCCSCWCAGHSGL